MIDLNFDELSLQYLNFFSIVDAGPLYSPIEKFDIRRTEDLSLVLNTVSEITSRQDSKRFPKLKSGAVVALDSEVLFHSKLSNKQAIARGVHTIETKEHADTPTRNRIREEYVSIQEIECRPDSVDSVVKVVEWIDNFDLTYFIWPDTVDIKFNDETQYYDRNEKLLFRSTVDRFANRRCLELEVAGYHLRVVPGKVNSFSGPNGKAAILYDGYPDAAFREKIRNCISLAIGVPLVSLGCVFLNEHYEHLGFQLFSPYTIDQAIFKIFAFPPAPIFIGNPKLVDSNTISRVVNSYFVNYEKFNLHYVFWLYWHAMCSASHAKPVQLGSAIESLIDSYKKQNKGAFSTSIVAKPLSRKIRKELLDALNKIQLDEDQKDQFTKKIDNINEASIRLKNQRFFDHLGLNLSSKELEAWQRRNDSAHGNQPVDGDTINLIKDISLLENLFHRVLLKVTNASPTYIDRFTEEHPIRSLTDSVEAIWGHKFA